MNDLSFHCPSCSHNLTLPAQKCPRCGSDMVPAKPARRISRSLIIFLLFCVIGPFGLGLLWRSDEFSDGAKWTLTLAVVVYTIVLLWVGYLVCAWALAEITQAMNQFQLF